MPKLLLSSLAVTVLGLCYYGYLTAVSFPPPIARIVPLVWLIASLISLGATLRHIRREGAGIAEGAIAMVGSGNLFFAGIFSLAALMGG